ncbi:MAG: AhpC/TSA family protein [Paramuribaculum sp.]|nr:AhpC/TSA family protein [Paramuribaculum sp.]
MNIKNLFFASVLTATVSCVAASSAPNYSVKVNFTPDEDGLMLYMLNYDNGAKIDSAVVDNGVAVFNGNITEPLKVQLVLDGSRAGQFFLEQGEIMVDPSARKIESTGKLYADYEKFNDKLAQLVSEYRASGESDEQRRAEISGQYDALCDSMMQANSTNVVGLDIFLNMAYNYSLAELDSALAQYPLFAKSARVEKLRTSLVKKDETSVGKKFKDFTITYDGKTQSLSDYVGKGHYTLVDFWASWCGPCIRETKVIKQLYEKYAPKGLEILGVAVWDQPENTLKAIEQHQLPWQQIIDAQSIPTDIYGISGIPCIILFDPEGNIVSRDKQDEDLVADVDKAMAEYLSAPTEVSE